MNKHISAMPRIIRVTFSLALLFSPVRPLAAQAPSKPAAALTENSFSIAAIDSANCGLWRNTEPVTFMMEQISRTLGFDPNLNRYWTAGPKIVADGTFAICSYRLAMVAPETVGSVLTDASKVYRLTRDAPFPGDPHNPKHWEAAVMTRAGGVAGITLATFAASTPTRALLFVDQTRNGSSTLTIARIYRDRFCNAMPLAGARAKTYYSAPDDFGGKAYPPELAASGTGAWISTGKNSEGIVAVPPISQVNQQWVIFSWEGEPRTLQGLFLRDNFSAFKIDTYAGPANITAQAALANEWQELVGKSHKVIQTPQGRWIALSEPLVTRGIRLRIRSADTGEEGTHKIARLDTIIAYEMLAEDQAPTVGQPPLPPPFELAYESPRGGIATLVIDNQQGERLKNLFAREPRPAGANRKPWDLLGDNGEMLMPGRYRWKLIAGPELKLRYEMSVYPNVSATHPQNTAWLNSNSGPGGWLADHTPPISGFAMDDAVYFGASVPESGVGFIACDLQGRKLWGIHSFDAWSGADGLTGADGIVYALKPAKGGGTDRIWAIDTTAKKFKTLYNAPPSGKRARGTTAMAARNGQLYVTVNAHVAMLANAASANDVALERCAPAYREARQPRRPYEIVPDERDDFLRLFRLKGDPPGYGHHDGQGLVWLKSTKGPQRRQEIMLVFNRPVAIGSCVFPVPQNKGYRTELSALKADAAFPPQAHRRDHWTPFATQASAAWDVAVAPPDTVTRALLVSFVKEGSDDLDDLVPEATAAPALLSAGNAPMAAGANLDSLLGRDTPVWQGELAGMRLLRRRFRNHFATAKVVTSSGKTDKNGYWSAERSTPLSPADPAIYMLQWAEPKKLCGVALEEIDGSQAKIDIFTGPPDAPVSLTGSDHWTTVATVVPRRRMRHPGFQGHNAQAIYMDDMVDFGREVETRAMRIRVVSQWLAETREGSCARDGLDIDPTRCRIFGVAPLEYIGGERPVDPLTAQRLEVIDTANGKVTAEWPLAKPTQLTLHPDGRLFAIADKKLVTIDPASGATATPFTPETANPGAMAFDKAGNLYLYDATPARRTIHAYAPDGRKLREIGDAGGYKPGHWNPRRLNNVTAITVDRNDQLWVVDNTYWPKRISCWTTAGEWLRDHIGPTEYGGGGVLDPADKHRLFYGPMEFEIDWQSGLSKLKGLTSISALTPGDMPLHLNGRTYLVTRPRGTYFQRYAVVSLYDNTSGVARPVAALGQADQFPPLNKPEIIAYTGSTSLENFWFTWSDANGDGAPQQDELTFTTASPTQMSNFNPDLSICTATAIFEVERFHDNGAPVYRERTLNLPTVLTTPKAGIYRLFNGNFYLRGDGPKLPEIAFDAAGKILWAYPNEGASVGPNRSCGPFTPGQVVCQFYMVGHETAAHGDLGEFFVVNANLGSWNVWTADGLLASRIFRDLRDPRRKSWSMTQNDRGMDISDVTAAEEHFNGWFARSQTDGKYYAVAGHNHASVVEVEGLDEFRRAAGDFEITAADIEATRAWRREMVLRRSRQQAKVIDIPQLDTLALRDKWAHLPRITIPAAAQAPERSIALQIGRDTANLHARLAVAGAGPFKNSAATPHELYRGGAAFDMLIGTDDQAPPERQAPVAGDKRLLIAMLAGRPCALLYDAVNPDAKTAAPWSTATPAGGRATFDDVRQIKEAGITVDGQNNGYTVTLTIPLATLGINPEQCPRIRFDWGILETDDSGNAVLHRTYWANKALLTTADAPTEARLEPRLWGWAMFDSRSDSRPNIDATTTDTDDIGSLLNTMIAP